MSRQTNPISILLINKNYSDCGIIREILESCAPDDMMLSTVSRIQDAQLFSAQEKCDIILFCIGPHDTSCIETLDAVINHFEDIPVVVLSNKHDSHTALRMIEAGAQDYLPIDEVNVRTLKRVLRYTIERFRYQRNHPDVRHRDYGHTEHHDGIFRHLFNATDLGVFFQLKDGTLADCNDALLKITGLTRKHITEKISDVPELSLMHEDGSFFAEEEHPATIALKTGKPVIKVAAAVYNAVRKAIIRVEVNAYPEFRQEETEAFRAIVTLNDIAGQQIFESTANNEKTFIRKLMEASKDTIFVFRPDTGKALIWNKAFSDISEYSDREIRQLKAPDSYCRKDDLVYITSEIEHILKNGNSTLEAALVTKSGKCIPFEYNATHLQMGKNGEHPVIVSIGRDISDRKQAESALRESELKYRTLFDGAIDGIVVVESQSGIIAECNKTICDMVGRTRNELIGKSQAILHPPEKLIDNLTGSYIRHRDTDPTSIVEADLLTGTGAIIPVEIRALRINISGVEHLLGFFRDITRQKLFEEEQENLRTLLYHSQKLEAIGQLASSVAHDFNNMLSGISGYTDLLGMKYENDRETSQFINSMRLSIDKATNLIQRLLTFSRKNTVGRECFDLHAAVRNALDLFEHSAGNSIRVERHLHPSSLYILADQNRLENCILNLLLNARDAMPRGGEIAIRTSSEVIDPSGKFVDGSAPVTGNYILLAISDSGTGITADAKPHIFEPFYTTKGTGKGTGLGLASVYDFMKQIDGHISLESTPGKGTCFTLYFTPITKGPSEQHLTAAGNTRNYETTILLTEGDPEHCNKLTIQLQSLGFLPYFCYDTDKALSLYALHHKYIQVVLLDADIPDTDSHDCMQKIRLINPRIPVIMGSRNCAVERQTPSLNDEPYSLVKKPYNIEELCRILKQASEDYRTGVQKRSNNPRISSPHYE